MIRKFKIINGKYNEYEGLLTYDTETNHYTITIPESYKGKHPDLMFKIWNSFGWTDIPEQYVMDWVESRVVCPERQGIEDILEHFGLDHYDVFQLLVICEGRCQMDSSYIVEIV